MNDQHEATGRRTDRPVSDNPADRYTRDMIAVLIYLTAQEVMWLTGSWWREDGCEHQLHDS